MSTPSPELPEDVLYILQRCDGFLDLKMVAKARAEWERVPLELRGQARSCFLRLLCEEKSWAEARVVLAEWCAREPDHAGAWIQLAYVTRRAESLQAAEHILNTARVQFPQEPVIVYNLACYACQAGRLEEARALLRHAAKLDPATLGLAGEDDDLRPLWPELPDP